MAVLDSAANEIVIRVLYDGPPEAGKTTSMRALAASLQQPSVTPEEDARGRTQWFDWMEYVGGRFEGCRIRCQIVSVPGQRELGHRRRALLASADVVVFVGDSTPERYPISRVYLDELRELLPAGPSPIGVIFQANKRDDPNAAPIEQIRADLGDARWSIGVVESIAADGAGIREAFVYAVRLALDRVRELIAVRALREGTPDETSPDQLLALLHAREAEHARSSLAAPRIAALDAGVSLASEVLDEVLASERAIETQVASPDLVPGAPRAPDSTVPSGAIWPPVEGRAILYEVSDLGLRPQRHRNGDWSAGAGTAWRLISARDAWFDTFEAGRTALVQWARLHAACLPVVSPRRCIVLAATGDGAWRLWQIVHLEPSLRELAQTRATSAVPADVALANFARAAQLLVDLDERLAQAPCPLAASLDTIGPCENASGAQYIGFMPLVAVEGAPPRRSPHELVAAELGPLLEVDHDGERRRTIERTLARFHRAS